MCTIIELTVPFQGVKDWSGSGFVNTPFGHSFEYLSCTGGLSVFCLVNYDIYIIASHEIIMGNLSCAAVVLSDLMSLACMVVDAPVSFF